MKKDVAIPWKLLDSFRSLILANYFGKVDFVVGIMNGGGIPAIVAGLSLDVPIYWLYLKSYKGRKCGRVEMETCLLPMDNPKGRILLVDDIFDSGKTLEFSLRFLDGLKFKNVQSVTMLSKDREKTKKMHVEYLLKAGKNQWVVFPWEHE